LAERREQARDFVGERRELVGRRPLGRQAGSPDLQNPPRLVDIVDGELVQGGQEAQRFDAQRRRTVRNVGTRSAARADDARGGERSQTGADRRTADADLVSELALRRETRAGLQRAAIDEPADVGDDLGGAVVSFRSFGCEGHDWFDQLYASQPSGQAVFYAIEVRLAKWLGQL